MLDVGENLFLGFVSQLLTFMTDPLGAGLIVMFLIFMIAAIAFYFIRLDMAEDARLGIE